MITTVTGSMSNRLPAGWVVQVYRFAVNLAALAAGVAGGASSPSCGVTRNELAGNLCKTSPAGSGYRHGKTLEVNVV